jgi:hypothetical protein
MVALCLAVGAICIPAGALAWDGGGQHGRVNQSNRNTQVTVVNNGRSMSTGLINVSQNTIPINVAPQLNIANTGSILDILSNVSNS